jgi:hypothetical protein
MGDFLIQTISIQLSKYLFGNKSLPVGVCRITRLTVRLNKCAKSLFSAWIFHAIS